jgi:hypothetical protein
VVSKKLNHKGHQVKTHKGHNDKFSAVGLDP